MPKLDLPWQKLVDTASEGLCLVDAKGIVQYANAIALTLLGLPSPDGAPAARWLTDLGDPNYQLVLTTIEKGGQVRLYLPGAEHKYLVFEAGPLAGTDATLGRIRRDYEVEASKIIAIMIHELRIPLTSIMGYAKMMLTVGAESLSDMQRQFLETINRNVERLDRNLSAVQDMTRIDRATVKLTPTALSVADVAELVLDELRPLAEDNENRVTLDFPDDLPLVHADADRLRQILRILLDNAIRYTPPGGHVRLHGHTTGDLVQIDVTDNGLGIPSADQERVFSKFFRGEDERIREHAGLGLDLFVARGLAQLHGGALWFDSTPGQGSTFSFTLPATQEKGQGE